jgi:hypothetical protein
VTSGHPVDSIDQFRRVGEGHLSRRFTSGTARHLLFSFARLPFRIFTILFLHTYEFTGLGSETEFRKVNFSILFRKHLQINISVARWSLDGRFLGLSDLEDVLPCKESKTLLSTGRAFGTTFRTSCSFSFDRNSKLEFLDPYLTYYEEGKVGASGSRKSLYPLPLKVSNFKRNGMHPNAVSRT